MSERLSTSEGIDLEKKETGRLLSAILLVMIVAATLAQFIYIVIDPARVYRYLLVIAVIDVTGVVLLYLTKRGYVYQAGNALILVTWALVTGLAVTDGGVHAPEAAAYFMIVFASGFILGERAGALTGLVCILTWLSLVMAEQGSILPPPVVDQSSISIWLIYSIFTAIIVAIQFIVARTIHRTYNQARLELEERRQAEAALRESEMRFQLALQDSPIFVYMTDRELRYTWVYNPPAGYTDKDLLGKCDEDIWPEDDARDMIAFKWEVLREASHERRLFHLQIGPERKTYDVSADPVLDDSNRKVIGLIVAAVDITERKALEDQNLQAQVQLELRRRLIENQEKERVRIAQDLHDGPVQGLVAAALALQGVVSDTHDPSVTSQVETAKTLLQEQIGILREFAGELRPPTLVKFGLEKAILSDMEMIEEKNPGITLALESKPENPILPEEIKLPLYRIYQETMRNILRHSGATRVDILLRMDPDTVEMDIQDNGIGFIPPKEWVDLARQGHLGLVGIQERAQAIGGHVEVRSGVGGGTRLIVRVPLPDQALEREAPGSPQ